MLAPTARLGQHLPPAAGPDAAPGMSVADALAAFLHSREAIACAARTIETYGFELKLFLRFLEARGLTEVGEISVPVVIDYLAWTHNRGVNATTLNAYRMRVCVFLNWCGMMGWVPPDIGRAIPRARPRHYTEGAVYLRVKRLGDAAGVKTHPHMWRHTFAAFAVRNGANMKALQHFLGHSSLQTTDSYLRGFGFEDAAREHKTFSPVGAMFQH